MLSKILMDLKAMMIKNVSERSLFILRFLFFYFDNTINFEQMTNNKVQISKAHNES